jgi:MarR-like DNA-binding transcriptional regulator SgrR of sgrS sRNA
MRWDNNISRYFDIKRGVRQGCIISSILFNLYSDFMITETLQNENEIKCNGYNVINFRYAANAVLMAETKKKLQKMTIKLNVACKSFGMAINMKKTKVMVISDKGKATCDITLDNMTIEQITRYKYLGNWITEDARYRTDIKARIGMAKAVFWENKEFMRRNVRFKTKMKILDCNAFSVLNYGCESWTCNVDMKRKVEAFEM